MKLKLWHIAVAFGIIIIIVRFELILNLLFLLYLYIELIAKDSSAAFNRLNLNLVDHLISPLLLIDLLIFVALKRKSSFLSSRPGFNSIVLIVLGYFFLYAPLICDFDPEFQKDLKVTRLLSPMSSVKVLKLHKGSSGGDRFYKLENEVVKSSFNNSVIFADSIKSETPLIYYQKQKEYRLESNDDSGPTSLSIATKLFILGSDEFGRDVFSRLVYGARVSLFVGLGSVAVTFFIGIILGFISGYFGGVADLFTNRISDVFLAFPAIFLIILLIALFGSSLFTVIIVFGFSGWMSLFKIVRSEVMAVKQKDYFVSAKLAGLPGSLLLRKEIFPVILAPVIVNLVLLYGNVILGEAALSYLGLGTGSFYPSWGAMIQSGQEYLTEAWWMIFFPGIVLFITLFAANSLGRKLKVYYNPRLMND